MRTLLKIFHNPRAAVADISRSPRWAGAFLLLAGAACALLVLGHPQYTHLTLQRLPQSATAGDIAEVREMLDRGLLLRTLFLPVRLLAGWSSFALVLMFAARAFARQPSGGFRHYLALEIHAEAIPMLGTLLGTCLGTGKTWLYPLLGTPNLFTLWYIVLLAYGVAQLSGTKLRSALVPVAGVWLLSLAFDLGVSAILSETLHLRV